MHGYDDGYNETFIHNQRNNEKILSTVHQDLNTQNV